MTPADYTAVIPVGSVRETASVLAPRYLIDSLTRRQNLCEGWGCVGSVGSVGALLVGSIDDRSKLPSRHQTLQRPTGGVVVYSLRMPLQPALCEKHVSWMLAWNCVGPYLNSAARAASVSSSPGRGHARRGGSPRADQPWQLGAASLPRTTVQQGWTAGPRPRGTA